jgi:hypothetical protein
LSVNATLQFLAYTVPAIMVLGGILLLLLGYPIGNGDMIKAGWGLILLGGAIYVVELILAYYSNQ